MRLKLGWLCVGFFAFYMVIHSLDDVNNLLAGGPAFQWLTKRPNLAFTSFLSFLSYSFLGYLLFFKISGLLPFFIIFLLYLFAGIPVMIGLRFFIQEMLGYWIFGVHNYNPRMLTFRLYVPDNIWFAMFYSSFGIVFFFVQYSAYNQLQKKEYSLRAREAELSFLRSQVNPHFLFNSLSNIYSLVYQQSDKSLAAISQLSNLLRYMVYDSGEKILLADELHFIENYINVQLLRYDYPVALKTSLKIEAAAKTIAPFLLLPLVENAFKHGCLKDTNQSLQISAHSINDEFLFEEKKQKKQPVQKIVAAAWVLTT